MHDLLSFTAMLLSGVLGALLVTPAQRTFADVRARVRSEFDRR